MARRLLVVALATALPAAAAATSLTPGDSLVSRAECVDRNNQAVTLSWDLGSSTGSSIEILAGSVSGCSSSSATAAVLVDGLSTSQTSYPQSGDTAITLGSVLTAAGVSPGTCDGSDFIVYVCVLLLSSSGGTVALASAAITVQLERPPPPVDVAATPGETALHVRWAAGTATAAFPAASKTYRAFAQVGDSTFQSSETSDTSARVEGLTNGTTYTVWVVAYSSAGNASDASDSTTGTPQHVLDFYDVYQASGGVEQGGCSHGGDSAGLALLGSAWLASIAARRRNRPSARPASSAAARRALLAAAALAWASSARAETAWYYGGEFSLRFQSYRPAIDSEFHNGSQPYTVAFGSGRAWGFRAEYARTFMGWPGTLGLGLSAGYFGASGNGVYRDGAGNLMASGDSTALHVFPVSLFFLYRVEALAEELGIPLTPYARVALERYMWVGTGESHASHTGATNGYSFTLGVALLLNSFDRRMAGDFERASGIRRTYLTFDATRAMVKDFGSSRSWDLSTTGWAFAGGLAFAF